MLYEMTDHLCRHCRGRILHDGDTLYRCAECGASVDGDDHEALCCCGLVLADGRDARFRCVVVPVEQRTPAVPFEVGVVRI